MPSPAYANRANRPSRTLTLSICGLLASLSPGTAVLAQAAPQHTLTIQAGKAIARSSPTLYGLMTEEINYSYDGGLYGEMVRNRAFTDPHWGNPHWRLAQNRFGGATFAIEPTGGPSAALPRCLKIGVTQATPVDPTGVANEGYWGYGLRPDTEYKASFYARADSPGPGAVTMSLVSDHTGKAVASGISEPIGGEWKQYHLTLHTGKIPVSSDYHLELTVAHPGTIWLDLVSVFPPTYKNRANGNRIDLMEKMAGLKPTFLRFPGGNYLEGDHIGERYEWKKTIGPLVDRPTHPSPWQYHSSDGLGLLEFLEWTEDLGIDRVLAVYAGYSMKQEHVNPGPELEPYVQDALDEIEYVTGGPETRWGAERVKDGHPAPFPLTYVEIGNEDNFDQSKSYDGRFAQFHDAIKKKYPNLRLIATMPVTSRVADVQDDHYYRSADEFFGDTHHYDKADRGSPTKIFVGEWATMEGVPSPDFGAALGDAAWMTGLERNSDLIVMAAYAPLLVNVNPGGMQWRTNLIGYNGTESYASPGYWAQALFDGHHGDEILGETLTGTGPRLFSSVTRDSATGKVYLKLVNASPKAEELTIQLAGAASVGSTGKVIRLHAESPADTNSIAEPNRIHPVEAPLDKVGPSFQHTVPGYSVEVVELTAK